MPEFIRAAADPINQPQPCPHLPLWAQTPSTPTRPCLSQVLTETKLHSSALNKQPFVTRFYFSPCETHLAQHPAFGSSLKGMFREKQEKQSKSPLLPQHILPAAPRFPTAGKKKIFSTQTDYRIGAPGAGNSSLFVHCILANSSSREKPPIPSPILHSVCFGLARHRPTLC